MRRTKKYLKTFNIEMPSFKNPLKHKKLTLKKSSKVQRVKT